MRVTTIKRLGARLSARLQSSASARSRVKGVIKPSDIKGKVGKRQPLKDQDGLRSKWQDDTNGVWEIGLMDQPRQWMMMAESKAGS